MRTSCTRTRLRPRFSTSQTIFFVPASQVAERDVDFFFVHRFLLVEINSVGKHDAHVHAWFMLRRRESGINREPGRQLVGMGLIEDVIGLAWFEPRAHGRELDVDVPIEGAEYALAIRCDAEAFRFHHDHHGRQCAVSEGEHSVGFPPIFGNNRLHRLGDYKCSQKEPRKAEQDRKRQTFSSSSK